MGLFSKLFGGKGDASGGGKKAAAEEYNGFLIYPEPIKDAGGFRVAARIEREIDGAMKTHQMVRADTMASETEARAESLRKAQVFIDQMGVGIFD
ncbi:HlyU family transcriptional regulator [Celeribacter sp.]|uniref:HlyU family transcriptional regulator n=1 Tax=Celeribacter sp. TaxID=1890673 RepID=UPI003A8D8117